jgi:predicted MPP superfamily phosphohydrolase
LQKVAPERVSRRKFLNITSRVLAAGAAAAAFSAWEAHRPVLERVEIRSPRLPQEFDGFTIAQLTDFHFDEYLHASYFEDVVAKVNALHPDLIALTGDYVTTPFARAIQKMAALEQAPRCARVVCGLRAPHGTLSVLGNHDHYTSPWTVRQSLMERHIPVLINEARAVRRGSARIWFCGIDSYFGAYRPNDTLAECPRDDFRIVLLHEPDCADQIAKIGADLMIAGHSHGGQVRIPLFGAPILPKMGRKYVMGRYNVGDMQLYVNRGIGVIHMPLRFACPPEITLFTLRRA